MRALLRADWLRIRRRRDVWVIVVGVCVIGAISFLSGYRTAVQDPPPFDPAAYVQELRDSGFFDGMTQADIDAQLPQMVEDQRAAAEADAEQREGQQAIELQQYAFPQSTLTVLGGALFPIGAMILITSMILGDEFRFGTIRTSLLAASDRRRFLAARIVSLGALAAALLLVQLLVGAILGLGLRLAGADVGRPLALDLVASLGLLLGDVLIAVALMLLATVITLLLRSGVLTLLLVILDITVEAFLTALPAFAAGQPLGAVPQFFLSTSVRTLQSQLGRASGAIALAGTDSARGPLHLEPPALVAIIVAWGLAFLVIADRRIRRMDIVE